MSDGEGAVVEEAQRRRQGVTDNENGGGRCFSSTGHGGVQGPLLGEDNEYVFKHIVGVGDDEFDALRADGVI